MPDIRDAKGPFYYHDGYYSDPEAVADAIRQYDHEGWELVSLIPPMQNHSVSGVWKHPTRKTPSWEE